MSSTELYANSELIKQVENAMCNAPPDVKSTWLDTLEILHKQVFIRRQPLMPSQIAALMETVRTWA